MTIKKRVIILLILILILGTVNSSIATADSSFINDFDNLISNFQNFVTSLFSGYSIFKITGKAGIGDHCKEEECEPGTYCTQDAYTVCCPEGKSCCIMSKECPDDLYCGGDRSAEYYGKIGICEPRLREGQGKCKDARDCVEGLFCNKHEGYLCQAEKAKVKFGDTCFNDDDCESGNCGPREDGKVGICCKSGEKCCNDNNPCLEGYKCDRAAGYYCVKEEPKKIDQKLEKEKVKRDTKREKPETKRIEKVKKPKTETIRKLKKEDYHHEKRCYKGDVYWFDISGKPTDLIQNCKSNEECKDEKCMSKCSSHYEKKCYKGDIYWFDSCGKKEDVYDDCSSKEACIDIDQPRCSKVNVGDGEPCTEDEDCSSKNCENNICCLKGERCCSKERDCNADQFCDPKVNYCVEKTKYKENGELCNYDKECKSNNCDDVCCTKGKTCCRYHADCTTNNMFCDTQYHFCNIKKELGQSCNEYDECKSGDCELGICCTRGYWGCCKSNADCSDEAYCDTHVHGCKDKKYVGDSCGGSEECFSGNCASGVCKEADKPTRSEYVGEPCGEFEDEIVTCRGEAYCLPTQKDSSIKICGKSGTMTSDYACRHDYDCSSGWYCANDYHGEFICLNEEAVRMAGIEEEEEPEPVAPEPTPTTPAYTPPTHCLHPQTGKRISIGETVCGEVLGDESSMTCSAEAHWISTGCPDYGCNIGKGTCCGWWATAFGAEGCHW